MCGIAGIWGESAPAVVQEMLTKQAHRGPDGRGTFSQQKQGILGHVRLSIMDPTYGQQPIPNEDNSCVIVANGEIYNHEWLRDRLNGGHDFGSTSDSETILHLFEEQGLHTTQQLDGMFAFAVIEDEALFLARDPIGIKPLYYGWQADTSMEQTLYFASELKAITPYVDHVAEFPPGTYYHSQRGFRQYYEVPHNIPRQLTVEQHIDNVRRTLTEAVNKRLMSDVPLGAFLSGGLDSSLIAALTRQQMETLHTFSVGIEGSSDIEAARRVAQHIDSVHHEYTYTADDVLASLPEVIYHLESYDQDLVRSAIPTYFCARMAAEYVKVILTGEGADELFAGYTYYKDFQDYDALHEELHRSVTCLHNLNLQRVDRLTMAHGLEGRVPFLDTDMVAMAQTIPAALKLRPMPNGQRMEKWVLRAAFEDLLPDDIVWRAKAQFDEGSGTVDLLESLLHEAAAHIDYETYAAQYPQDKLRSVEECYYHQILCERFSQPARVLPNVGRWALHEIA